MNLKVSTLKKSSFKSLIRLANFLKLHTGHDVNSPNEIIVKNTGMSKGQLCRLIRWRITRNNDKAGNWPPQLTERKW